MTSRGSQSPPPRGIVSTRSAPTVRNDCESWLGSYHESARPLADEALATLVSLAVPVSVDAGHIVTRQFASADRFYVLVEGSVRFQVQVDQAHEGLAVGMTSVPWTPIGWSGFQSPGRYATTVTSVSAGRLMAFDQGALADFLTRHPDVSAVFLGAVLAGAHELLTSMRARLSRVLRTPATFGQGLKPAREEEAYNRAPPPLAELLRQAPFFEVFDERQLERFAAGATSRYYCRGEPVLRQGAKASGLWILATGRVALNYCRPGERDGVTLRTRSAPGAVVAWAGWGGIDTHATSVVATRDCTLYHLDPTRLATDPAPGLAQALTRRLLWLVSTHLRDARALFISGQFEQENVAVRSLLEQHCTQLSVGSPLHRLPHLLNSAYTLGDAFRCLEEMSSSDDSLERSLAKLCRDILGEVRREHEIFEALRRVYHAVVTAPPTLSPKEVRSLCARGFREAFSLMRSEVKGEELLPSTSGHIFVFNHLKNHEYNTLPNNFQLTLDSHFVSAVILDRRYGDAGVRVVRKSRGTEYGHQNYYDRLGHISVYTPESDEIEETPEETRARRNEFFEQAGAYLVAGTNIMLSPEGTSFWTEDSPGPFKPGAFRLAAHVEPEPLIVPIAVANFDRRMHSTVCAAVVKSPFRMSDVVADPHDPAELYAFLEDYRRVYATYVQEARALAAAHEPRYGREDVATT